MSRNDKIKRFITRFDTTECKSQKLNYMYDLMDDEGFLPFHLRLNRIKIATAIHKAYSNGLNEGYKKHLEGLEELEGDASIVEELSISRYDDLQLQQAFIRGFENSRAYLPSENSGKSFSETPNSLSADGNISPDGAAVQTENE